METLSKQQGLLVKESEVAQSCLTLCDPVDCSLQSKEGVTPKGKGLLLLFSC